VISAVERSARERREGAVRGVEGGEEGAAEEEGGGESEKGAAVVEAYDLERREAVEATIVRRGRESERDMAEGRDAGRWKRTEVTRCVFRVSKLITTLFFLDDGMTREDGTSFPVEVTALLLRSSQRRDVFSVSSNRTRKEEESIAIASHALIRSSRISASLQFSVAPRQSSNPRRRWEAGLLVGRPVGSLMI